MPPLDQRSRILIVVVAVVAVAISAMMLVPSAADGSQTITLYKSPTCGCCADWADRMAAQGFRIDRKLRTVEDIHTFHSDTQAIRAEFRERGIDFSDAKTVSAL